MPTVTNTKPCLVYGPPFTSSPAQPTKFHPGRNEVRQEYWDFCLKHSGFKRTCLDTGIIVGSEETAVSDARDATSEAEAIKKLHQLNDLGGCSLAEAGRAIELINDRALLARWAKSEQRAEVKTIIVGKLARTHGIG